MVLVAIVWVVTVRVATRGEIGASVLLAPSSVLHGALVAVAQVVLPEAALELLPLATTIPVSTVVPEHGPNCYSAGRCYRLVVRRCGVKSSKFHLFVTSRMFRLCPN